MPEPSLELPSLFKRKRRTPLVEEGRSPVTRPRDRRIPPLPAAVLTGALVGLLTAGLVWLSLRGCSGLRGTSSCGDTGFLVLVAIFVVLIFAGRFALTVLRVADAGSTSFLGLALLAVLALVFVDDLGSVVGAVVLALVGAATFGLAQWVTATFTEPGERPR
jgi:hypothetical protein